ncbi:Oxidoreductase, molybdopterin-binding domain-containing protein [Linnemannia elongata]|nr:Oxidoreductase, molybdopterin-binding domain-containing protein [Linnemannia elongata]
MNTQHNTTHDCVRPPVHEKKELCDLDYSQDPPRILSNYLVHAPKPFNAEPHLPLLVNAGLITPTDVFFKRNHGPIPDIRLEDHQVYIGVQTLNESQPVEWKALNMHDIMTRWPKATITASLQHALHRNATTITGNSTHAVLLSTVLLNSAPETDEGLAQLKEVKGVIWKAGTISNALVYATFSKDIAGVPEDLHNEMIRNYHVSFEADDHVKEDACYGSSIPLRKAMDPLGDVIIAYEMNGQPLTRDHGFPLRVIVPGYIGARSVKFLQKILVQPQESTSFFQRRDYKILPPWGYAISGGGRAIYRVELSVDGGKNWEPVDKIEQTPDKISGMYWAWALWEKKVPKILTTSELVVRAYDSSGNMQPEFPIWNYRGVMNNAWFRVNNVTQMPQHNM